MRPLFAAMAMLGTSCVAADEFVVLHFQARVGDAPIGCLPVRDIVSQAPVGTPEVMAQLADARLFVSEVELRNESGEWVALTTVDAFPWRRHGVTLLDFESGTALCGATGTVETNEDLSGSLPAGTYQGLRFTVGVPAEANAIPLVSTNAPTTIEAMYVDEAHGYRFLRFDLAVEARANRRWRVDLGSSGEGYRPRITLDDYVLGEDRVVIDLGALVASSDLGAIEADETGGCLPEDDDGLAGCPDALEALGLSPDTGSCVNDCTGQTVFSTEALPEL